MPAIRLITFSRPTALIAAEHKGFFEREGPSDAFINIRKAGQPFRQSATWLRKGKVQQLADLKFWPVGCQPLESDLWPKNKAIPKANRRKRQTSYLP